MAGAVAGVVAGGEHEVGAGRRAEDAGDRAVEADAAVGRPACRQVTCGERHCGAGSTVGQVRHDAPRGGGIGVAGEDQGRQSGRQERAGNQVGGRGLQRRGGVAEVAVRAAELPGEAGGDEAEPGGL